jgi:hypothetical protein
MTSCGLSRSGGPEATTAFPPQARVAGPGPHCRSCLGPITTTTIHAIEADWRADQASISGALARVQASWHDDRASLIQARRRRDECAWRAARAAAAATLAAHLYDVYVPGITTPSGEDRPRSP